MTALSEHQIQAAGKATYEVLKGADASRVLELMDDLFIARQLMLQIARGELTIGRKDEGTETEGTAKETQA